MLTPMNCDVTYGEENIYYETKSKVLNEKKNIFQHNNRKTFLWHYPYNVGIISYISFNFICRKAAST